MILGWGSQRSWIFHGKKVRKKGKKRMITSALTFALGAEKYTCEYPSEHYYCGIETNTVLTVRETIIMLLRIKEYIPMRLDLYSEILACGWLDYLSRPVSASFWTVLTLFPKEGNSHGEWKQHVFCSQRSWVGIPAGPPLNLPECQCFLLPNKETSYWSSCNSITANNAVNVNWVFTVC